MSESSRPIEREADLAGYFAAGAKPRAQWGIGLEYERFGVRADDLSPVPYDGPRSVRGLLESLAAGPGWSADREGDLLLGARHGATRLTLEPGCQLEMSGGVHADLDAAQRELFFYLDAVETASAPLGLLWMGVGMQPFTALDALPWFPKKRYAVMRDYLPRRGTRGLTMMKQTACIQVNLDYSDEADAFDKMRAAMGLTPIVTALFAHSPLTGGAPNGFLSARAWAWRDTDPDRCGLLPFVFREKAGFGDYLDYALDVPLFFIVRDGRYLPGEGKTFRDWIRGRVAGGRPTLEDFETHLTTLFPEVRLKHYIELRGADSGDPRAVLALGALWKGLLYDRAARDSSWELVRSWSFEERNALLDAVCRDGPAAPLPARGLRPGGPKRAGDLFEAIVAAARRGLEAQGTPHEARWLEPLQRRIASGSACPALELLDRVRSRGADSRDLAAALSRNTLRTAA
ncbi:MAG TPA: glutamate-cysteine ligase family protein [Candidatus Polarisedimenticolia bacterium]|nr:glutamate-cysteine ligase family protein [Candidatus Polarisedimenticolia bacterium]